MSWVTVIWSVGGGACLTLALIQFVVWWKNPSARANLVFAVMAAAVAVFALLDLHMMRAETPEQFGTALRWLHVPTWVIIASLVGFVRLYLRAGRRWLAWTIVSVRTLSLILNFTFSPNINYRQITAIRHILFLGESVSIAEGVPNPWMLVGQFSLLLLVIFVMDATITVWRRDDQQQALIVGGSILLFVVAGTAQAIIIMWGIIPMPVTASLFYQGLVVVMAYQLSYDVLHAAALARQLQASEATRRESEERMSLAAEAANLAVWEWDPSTNEVWTTGTRRALPGPPVPERGTLESFISRLHIDDRDRVRQALEAAINGGEDFACEFRFTLPDGRVRWATARGRFVRTPDSKNMRFRGVSMDVTAQKDVDNLFRLAAEGSHLGVWHCDEASQRISWDGAARNMFGVSADADITLDTFYRAVHPDDLERVKQARRQALELQLPYQIEYRTQRTDGTICWVHSRGRGDYDESGKPLSMSGVVFDITVRKKAEELFKLATEASPSGTVLIDHEGRIVLVNAHAEELFGYARDELIGKNADILLPERFGTSHESDSTNFLVAPEARAMGSDAQLFARRKDGSEVPVEISVNSVQTPDGVVVLAHVIDVSARLATEEVARQSREQVELLSRVSLLGEMTASLAHELNQPLAAIVNNATAAMQYLEQGRLDPKQLQEILTDVVDDGHRAYDVVRNVRSAIKKGSAIRARINLNDVAKAVTYIVQPDAAAQSCKMELFLARDLPATEGDPTQIQQAVINLVHNAFDAMDHTPSNLRTVEIATSYNGDGTICVAVRDHGSGISEATRQRLFEQFFTTKEEGLGMGLAIVRSIIEAHGGSVTAENAEGGGARFSFHLPIGEGA
jgi:PAS domain S-box-containing protein